MRRVDGLGIAGLLMTVVGAGTFFGGRGVLPLWLAWMVGPLLWYLGFAVIVSWLACRIFGAKAEPAELEGAEEEKPQVMIHLRSNFHEHDSDVPLVEARPRKLPVAGISAAVLVLVFSSALMYGADAPEAAATFKAKCAMCHGPDGTGKTAMGAKFNVPDLRSEQVQKQPDAEIVQAITKGKNKMPAYGDKLNAAEIQGLKGYIRELAKKH